MHRAPPIRGSTTRASAQPVALARQGKLKRISALAYAASETSPRSDKLKQFFLWGFTLSA
jgi:hypothetical protein